MKKLIALLFVGALFAACSEDKELTQEVDAKAADYSLDISAYDNSNLGVYKGVFSTLDSEDRGTLEVQIKEGLNSRAALTLVTGQEIKFSSTVEIGDGVNMNEVLFVADGASFKFSVGRDGSNPLFSEVTLNGVDAAMKGLKETSRLAVTAQTGTWGCSAGCAGSGTWNLTFVTGDGTGDYAADITTMIMFNGGDVGTAAGNVQDTCVDGGDVTTCNMAGATTVIPSTGAPIFWNGTHSYTSAATPNCSEASGTWSSGTGLTGTWTSDVTCFTQGNFPFDPIAFTPNAEGSGCATATSNFVFADWTGSATAGSCGSGPADVWYSFTANATGLTIFTTAGSTLSTPWWTVYDTGLTEVDCITGSSFGAVSLTGLTVGVDYLLQLSGNQDVDFCIEDFDVPTGPPANDLCGDATAIACDETVTGNTSTATDSDTSRGNDVWYTFDGTSVAAGTEIQVSLCASSYDTWLGVYTDCTFTGLVTSNDDNSSECGSFGPSYATFINDGTTQYIIRVDGFNASSFGAYELTLTCVVPDPPPANDLCADAEPIACGASVSGDTSSATDETGTRGQDVFYSFTGTGTPQDVTVSLCGSSFDTFLNVLDACGGVVVASNDDSCGVQSELTFSSDGTSTYIIIVEAFSTGNGPFDLNITCVDSFGAGTITNVEKAASDKLTEEQQYELWKNKQ